MWGKILGGVAGFVAGGPFGAVLGAALGHAADEGTLPSQQARRGLGGPDMAALLGSRETVFAVGVVVLSAKLAKCDGVVKREEIDAFKAHFRIPPESMPEVAQLFDRARDTAQGAEPFAQRMGQAFADQKPMLEDVLTALFHIARADGPPNRAELAYLEGVHRLFGLDAEAWARAAAGRGRGNRFTADDTADAEAYATLGLTASASPEELRQAWKKLMRENHPDSLAAKGQPADIVQRATRRVAEINAAWDRIKRERKL